MVTETSYGLSKKLSIPYEEALPKVKDALREEGWTIPPSLAPRRSAQFRHGLPFPARAATLKLR